MRRNSHPFWRYSLRLYGRPEVAEACLALQEEAGADVNILLFCCWMGAGGHRLDRRFLRRLIAATVAWQAEVVQPLRRARRALKKAPGAAPRLAASLRKGIAAAELDAEYLEQRMIAGLAAALAPPRRKVSPVDAAGANLASYLELIGAPADAQVRERVATLIRQL